MAVPEAKTTLIEQSLTLVTENGQLGCRFSVADTPLHLPIKNVGSPKEPVILFLFDPNVEAVRTAGTSALAQLIQAHHPDATLWVTPQSDKSTPMIVAAHKLSQPSSSPSVQVLARAKHPETLDMGPDGTVTTYRSVTSPTPKMLGITAAQRTLVANHKVILLDDVYSTGGTTLAAQEIMGVAAPVVVVAREVPVQDIHINGETLTFSYPQLDNNDVVAACTIPLITGETAHHLATLITPS